MAKQHGKTAAVMLDQTDMSTYFTSVSKSVPVDAIDATMFATTQGVANDSKVFFTGLNDGTVSLEGLFDGTTVGNFDWQLWQSYGTVAPSQGITTRFLSVGLNGLMPGDRVWQVAGMLTAWDVASPIADVVTTSVEFQADSGIGDGFSLADPATAVSVDGFGTAVDYGTPAPWTLGGAGHLHVQTNLRNVNTTIAIQHSPDNSVWADLIVFTMMVPSFRPCYRVEIDPGTPVDRWMRTRNTMGVGTGTFNYHASFARR